MKYREYYSIPLSSMRAKRKRRFFIPVFIICICVCGVSMAGEMVPFVIPAKPNPNSLIAVTSIESIKTNSNRLQAQDGHQVPAAQY